MARRQVLEIPGVQPHGGNPIPTAVKIGGFVFSGSIPGIDPATGRQVEDPAGQIAMAFANARRIMELAGGSADDIAKVDVRLSDMALREQVNVEWVKLFPDAASRPARHTTRADLAGSTVIQLEIVGVLG